eukprot:1825018-Lingulodinium_polyedra.AAC.1
MAGHWRRAHAPLPWGARGARHTRGSVRARAEAEPGGGGRSGAPRNPRPGALGVAGAGTGWRYRAGSWRTPG